MNQSVSNLKLAERWCYYKLVTAYLFLSAAKLAAGHLTRPVWSRMVSTTRFWYHPNVALLYRSSVARQPADRDHRFGHWKIEDNKSYHLYHHELRWLMFCAIRFKRLSVAKKLWLTHWERFLGVFLQWLCLESISTTHLNKQSKSKALGLLRTIYQMRSLHLEPPS